MRQVDPRFRVSYVDNDPIVLAHAWAEVAALFNGLRLVEPGVVLVNRWHPDGEALATPDEHVHIYGGVVGIKR